LKKLLILILTTLGVILPTSTLINNESNLNSIYTSDTKLDESKINAVEIEDPENEETLDGVGKEDDDLHPTQTKGQVAWELFKSHWKLTLLSVITAVLSALVGLQVPQAMGHLVNVVSRALAQNAALPELLLQLKPCAIQLLSLFLSKASLTAAHIAFVTWLGENLASDLRTRLFYSLLTQDLAFFDLSRSGESSERLISDVSDFKATFKLVIPQAVTCFTSIIGTLFQLIAISPNLTGYLIMTLPPVYLGLYLHGRVLRKIRSIARNYEIQSAGFANEILSSIRTVRAFSTEELETEKYKQSNKVVAGWNNLFGFHLGVFRGFMTLAVGSVMLTVLYFGGMLVIEQKLSTGELMTFLVAAQGAQGSMDHLGGLIGQTMQFFNSADRILSFLVQPPSTTLRPKLKIGLQIADVQGGIEFRNVDFAYPTRPDQPILDQLNLSIAPGTTVALCGPSGVGKTTIGQLVERFYEVDNGEILLDGYPLHFIDPKWLRKNVLGYLSQEPTLFAGSILDNIKYGKPEASMEEVVAACRAANAHEFITQFDNGYQTQVGERGVSLSGGQKQRIAIARTILKDPKILILDEATSALDNHSERVVQEALNRLMKDRTTIIIAHRLTTIQNSDVIIVLGKVKGNIAEMGNHEALMKLKGEYYQLREKMNTN
jgi:ATP-binding cassette subfamily B (MDR/TAP) protein 8